MEIILIIASVAVGFTVLGKVAEKAPAFAGLVGVITWLYRIAWRILIIAAIIIFIASRVSG